VVAGAIEAITSRVVSACASGGGALSSSRRQIAPRRCGSPVNAPRLRPLAIGATRSRGEGFAPRPVGSVAASEADSSRSARCCAASQASSAEMISVRFVLG
jgi:hypothetical protein